LGQPSLLQLHVPTQAEADVCGRGFASALGDDAKTTAKFIALNPNRTGSRRVIFFIQAFLIIVDLLKGAFVVELRRSTITPVGKAGFCAKGIKT
jgi:hypothetical protein